MKRVGLIFLVGAFVMLLNNGTPQAYHSGGVAECGGCHSMHSAKVGGSFLLVGTDASSTCLTCHSHEGDLVPTRYHIATPEADLVKGKPPIQRNPGGDFGWLKKDYEWSPRAGTIEKSWGYDHGHNIVAADTTFAADPDKAVAPGGTFPSSQLGCASCHDPHGRVRRLSDGSYVNAIYTPGSTNAPIMGSGSYDSSPIPGAGLAVGNYRLLRGMGDISVPGVTFANVGIAVAPATYNQSEAVNQVRVAYGANGANTWGNWCGSCHPDMHGGLANYKHPVDQALGADIANAYNAYKKSGDLTGLAASSYSSLVPFAEATGDIATLKLHAKNNNSYLNGPAASDRVTCLSCHRAHASGFDYGLRWSMAYEFMVVNGTYTGTAASGQGRTEEEMAGAYYDRPASQFASYQRVLCNKCHAKD